MRTRSRASMNCTRNSCNSPAPKFWYSKAQPSNDKVPAMPIGDWLASREQLSPQKIALVDATQPERRPITYRAWNRAANRTAHLLRERFGVRKGDRVAVLALNCVEYLDIWFACGKLGAILQNLNWRLTPPELVGLLADAAPSVLVYGPDFLPQVAALREQPLLLQHYVALDPDARADVHRDRLFARHGRSRSRGGPAMQRHAACHLPTKPRAPPSC